MEEGNQLRGIEKGVKGPNLVRFFFPVLLERENSCWCVSEIGECPKIVIFCHFVLSLFSIFVEFLVLVENSSVSLGPFVFLLRLNF